MMDGVCVDNGTGALRAPVVRVVGVNVGALYVVDGWIPSATLE